MVGPDDGLFFSLYFRKDREITTYKLKVDNILDWLAYVGGFYKALFGIGYVFVSIFGYNIFVSSIMKRLYYFEDEEELEKD